jgi:hypothetical protein
MEFDSTGRRFFVAYRLPALITAFDTQTGKLVGRQPTCGDADDAAIETGYVTERVGREYFGHGAHTQSRP